MDEGKKYSNYFAEPIIGLEPELITVFRDLYSLSSSVPY